MNVYLRGLLVPMVTMVESGVLVAQGGLGRIGHAAGTCRAQRLQAPRSGAPSLG